ncbi:ribosome assembly cofactor RimP [Flavobacterium paronense]|uniref:Ribosome maturation factor RimP n=1 Tax=Flavobacterium paronense TaxID=1392775 RepID=A0ABV5GFI3_9FLAO|nr:ribosome assembly cofactor RimP [Flavobacterium paronense]MDN3676084.1 ribosome assembly cofactor RimP [Flavobacterium paronense]
MAFRDKILALLEEGLKEKPSLFLVDLTVSETFKVIVTLDGDNGVNLQDCIDISRAVDTNLDREEQDYALEVASAGVSTPLKMVRQYRKNIGRTLKVKTSTETIEAVLDQVSEESIALSWTAREPKKIGKGKETVAHKREIPYSDIKEAIVTIIFN